MNVENQNLPSSDTVTHYRLVSELARQQALYEQDPAAPDLRADRISLASIAATMNVPVVLANFRDRGGKHSFVSHGLGHRYNLAGFAATCDALCVDKAVVIPNARNHQALSMITKLWPVDDVRFLVGIPLRDETGRRVGSLMVMNTSKAVAARGISFRTLTTLGEALVRRKLPMAA